MPLARNRGKGHGKGRTMESSIIRYESCSIAAITVALPLSLSPSITLSLSLFLHECERNRACIFAECTRIPALLFCFDRSGRSSHGNGSFVMANICVCVCVYFFRILSNSPRIFFFKRNENLNASVKIFPFHSPRI